MRIPLSDSIWFCFLPRGTILVLLALGFHMFRCHYRPFFISKIRFWCCLCLEFTGFVVILEPVFITAIWFLRLGFTSYFHTRNCFHFCGTVMVRLAMGFCSFFCRPSPLNHCDHFQLSRLAYTHSYLHRLWIALIVFDSHCPYIFVGVRINCVVCFMVWVPTLVWRLLFSIMFNTFMVLLPSFGAVLRRFYCVDICWCELLPISMLSLGTLFSP